MTEPSDEELMARFRAAVEQRGQGAVAETLGVHQTTVSGWFRGTHSPSKHLVKLLRKAFG